MRCKSCLEIFSQPSPETKKTQTCSICRGIKTCLKRKQICEKTEKILLNRNNSQKIRSRIIDKDHDFIERHDLYLRPIMVVRK